VRNVRRFMRVPRSVIPPALEDEPLLVLVRRNLVPHHGAGARASRKSRYRRPTTRLTLVPAGRLARGAGLCAITRPTRLE
jgi:hypothetical protein